MKIHFHVISVFSIAVVISSVQIPESFLNLIKIVGNISVKSGKQAVIASTN
jgi:hypothetical protein